MFYHEFLVLEVAAQSFKCLALVDWGPYRLKWRGLDDWRLGSLSKTMIEG